MNEKIDLQDAREYLAAWGCLANPNVAALLDAAERNALAAQPLPAAVEREALGFMQWRQQQQITTHGPGCHAWVHAHPAASRCLGLTVPSGSSIEAADSLRVSWKARRDPNPCPWRTGACHLAEALPQLARLCAPPVEGGRG